MAVTAFPSGAVAKKLCGFEFVTQRGSLHFWDVSHTKLVPQRLHPHLHWSQSLLHSLAVTQPQPFPTNEQLHDVCMQLPDSAQL